MSTTTVIELIDNFDDERIRPDVWNRLLEAGPSVVPFLTWEWQRAWWDSFGTGQLMIARVSRADETVALVPMYTDAGMVYFVGSGGSDYLDVIGDIGHDMGSVLRTVVEAVTDFVGGCFYHLPDGSGSRELLWKAAVDATLAPFEEGSLPAPVLVLDGHEDVANKKSLVRHERWFAREGELAVHHTSMRDEIEPYLDDFFEQHVERWHQTPFPSLFLDTRQRDFYRRLVARAGTTGWLRFTRVEWNGRNIAYHLGASLAGRYLWYKPTFAIDLARRSPGEVLLRQLLLAAIDENATLFDFGLGDEPFKHRFATSVPTVRTVGVYRPEALP